MGKLILIRGANDSGKSRRAEAITSTLGAEQYYIATMIPYTEDNRRRIEKHRRQREAYGFVTYELPYCVGTAGVTENAAVLLEDVPNLLANNMFERSLESGEVLRDILKLKDRCRTLIAVTISGLNAEAYGGETAAYINNLNRLNAALFDLADAVIEMRDGQAHTVKGERDDADQIPVCCDLNL